jgi:hypothetical protein
MITQQQAVDLMVLWFNIGIAVLALAAFGGLLAAVWAIRRRQRAWDDYLRTREKMEQGTRIVHIEPSKPWPKQ